MSRKVPRCKVAPNVHHRPFLAREDLLPPVGPDLPQSSSTAGHTRKSGSRESQTSKWKTQRERGRSGVGTGQAGGECYGHCEIRCPGEGLWRQKSRKMTVWRNPEKHKALQARPGGRADAGFWLLNDAFLAGLNYLRAPLHFKYLKRTIYRQGQAGRAGGQGCRQDRPTQGPSPLPWHPGGPGPSKSCQQDTGEAGSRSVNLPGENRNKSFRDIITT